MWDMNTLASMGPRRDPIATPSVCSYMAPLNIIIIIMMMMMMMIII